jgi:hypothetical protein
MDGAEAGVSSGPERTWAGDPAPYCFGWVANVRTRTRPGDRARRENSPADITGAGFFHTGARRRT